MRANITLEIELGIKKGKLNKLEKGKLSRKVLEKKKLAENISKFPCHSVLAAKPALIMCLKNWHWH